MIDLKSVSLRASGKQILDRVSLRIGRGETFVILGPSGAGKSSVLKIMCGLWQPNGGQVFVEGTDITSLTDKFLRRVQQKIAMVFQGNALFDSLNVAENVAYFLRENSNWKNDRILQKVDQTLAFVNMEHTANMRIDELSGGMKKRVAIARALAADPDILLFDEPTTGLDPINTRAVLEVINKIRNSGKTSVVVTHILQDAFAVASRMAVIKDGKVVANGNRRDLLETEDPFVQDFISEFQLAANPAII